VCSSDLVIATGCLSNATVKPTTPTATSTAANMTYPKVDARATLDLLKTFSQAYPYRQSGTTTHDGARDALEKSFKDAGLETMRQKFPTRPLIPAASSEGVNILGIKWGKDRDHWIVVGGHYDVTEGAVFGTYDDGSGTVLTAKLAQAFSKSETDRTIAFIEFDQEERGLVGSAYFVKSIVDGTFPISNVTVDGMIDLDMVGITWPHPAHLVCWQNSPSLTNETRALANATGIPEKNLEFRKPKGGSSDGASFIKANIATTYFWSDWDDVVMKDGTKYAGPYPFWHQADTYDTMVQMAGDEATLQKGFQTTLDVVSPLLAYAASAGFAADGQAPT
jgi:hypothetical protein